MSLEGSPWSYLVRAANWFLSFQRFKAVTLNLLFWPLTSSSSGSVNVDFSRTMVEDQIQMAPSLFIVRYRRGLSNATIRTVHSCCNAEDIDKHEFSIS